MPNTYEPIATTTANGSVSFVDFSSIPSTYTDLVLIGNTGANGSHFLVIEQINSTTALCSTTLMYGNGTSSGSWRSTSNVDTIYLAYSNPPASSNIQESYIVHFMNYSNTTTNKTILARYNCAAGEAGAVVGLWRSTSALNSFRVRNSGGVNFVSGSTFTLYGIKAA